MFGERDTSPPTSRDIAGAWLFCMVLALLAVALTSRLDGGLPTAAEITCLMPCTSAAPSLYPPSADAEGPAVATAAGLHRLAMPGQRPRGEHRKG